MQLPAGRPRFEKAIPLEPDQAIAAIQAKLAEPNCPCRGYVADLHHHFDLRIHNKDHKLWSPMLSGNVIANEEGAVIQALVGPNPNIWTAVAFSYLASFTGLLFLLTFGAVQLGLGQDPWAFLAGLGILVFATIVWALSKLGQRLAADQIVILRDVLDETFSSP
jgi:hypothetical protein